MKRLLVALVAGSVATAFATSALDAIAIKRTPKVGEKVISTLSGTLTLGGRQITMTGKSVDEVISVEPSGDFSIKTTQTNTSVDGTSAPDGPPVTVTFKPSGEITKIAGDATATSGLRLQNLVAFYYPSSPVNVGGSWSFDLKPNGEGAVPLHADMKLDALEKVSGFDAVKVEGTTKETVAKGGGTAHSIFWINLADGTLVKQTSDLKGVTLGPSQIEKGTITMTRVAS